jgi:hypothetical protein
VDLAAGAHVLGRSSSCSVPLRDPSLSREHCEIIVQSGAATLKDRGSMNGTTVNGRRVAEHPLKPGDKITIGGAVVWYDRKEGAVPSTARRIAPSVGPDVVDTAARTRRPGDSPQEAKTESRRSAAAVVRDYSGWGKAPLRLAPVASAIGALIVLAGLAAGVTSLVGRGGGSEVDADNLLQHNPSFEQADGPRPLGWSAAGRASGAVEVVPAQGRSGSSCLVLDKKGGTDDLLLECFYTEDIALGASGAVEASAYFRCEDFSGAAGLKVDWLRTVGGAVLAEHYGVLAPKAADWTLLHATFTPPAGAGAFRLALAAVGRAGRVYFDDVRASLRTGPPAQDFKLGVHRVAMAPSGACVIELRGRRSLLNLHARLESDREGTLPQTVSTGISVTGGSEGVLVRGRMQSPVDFREIEFEERIVHQEGQTTVLYGFGGNEVRQLDRVAVVFTLPRVERVGGLPAADQTTRSISFASDDGDVVVEYRDPARVRTERVRGGLRVVQTFPVDSGATDQLIQLTISDAGRGGAGGDPLRAATEIRRERPGDALALLRKHLPQVREPARREEVEGHIRQLEADEQRELADLRSRGFEAWVSRRADLANRGLEAVDLYERRWKDAGSASVAAALREKLREFLRTELAEQEAERPRRILDRAKASAESGRRAVARALLETLRSRYPASEAAAEAQQLLRTLGP